MRTHRNLESALGSAPESPQKIEGAPRSAPERAFPHFFPRKSALGSTPWGTPNFPGTLGSTPRGTFCESPNLEALRKHFRSQHHSSEIGFYTPPPLEGKIAMDTFIPPQHQWCIKFLGPCEEDFYTLALRLKILQHNSPKTQYHHCIKISLPILVLMKVERRGAAHGLSEVASCHHSQCRAGMELHRGERKGQGECTFCGGMKFLSWEHVPECSSRNRPIRNQNQPEEEAGPEIAKNFVQALQILEKQAFLART